ncbi:uncharacterized protein LOC119372631 isoform X1 [Rhipicephalus sanguineus]|uniref:uncharacterized protein LOC119372631 isoform X1 n=1 Tax=Rhipicephalus sanguineus TaxID=34632 RepID=UPI001894888C|nr:uncharacterized protein LOC119372631 isoform X1 [Rhipicephalus sanguineus]
MQLSYAYPILSLVLLSMAERGAAYRLYLEQQAKEYIERVNATYRGRVSSWGLTSTYAYWHQRHPPKEHPVKAEVDWISYSNCRERMYTELRTTDCIGVFAWSASAGITCPFSLKEYTMLPVQYKGLPGRMVELELNGLNITTKTLVWGDQSNSKEAVFVAMCEFSAKIDFDGFFAYSVTNSKEHNFRFIAVNITELADETKGLEAKRGKLTYELMGAYRELIWCSNNEK